MLFKRYYDDKLAQASYLLACERTGEAVVVDPNRDIEFYVRAAAGENVRIVHVTETHIHADYLSGSRELALRTGATLHLSDEGGDGWRYAFAAESRARLLKEGDEIAIGNVRLRALHTPGHTPEHLAFLVFDLRSSAEPLGMLSGDFIFVGEVGRPDLLERAAKQAGTMRSAAQTLYRSIQKLAPLPDYLQIWPGHGAGSACGKSLGSMPQSTLGFERLSNWAFRVHDEDAFIREVLSGQPTPPLYFAEMKRLNRDGPPILNGMPNPEILSVDALKKLIAGGGVVLDTRHHRAYTARHIAGSVSVPFNRNFTTRAGSAIGYEHDIALIVDDSQPGAVAAVARDLAMIGLDRVRGAGGLSLFQQWVDLGLPTSALQQLSPAEAASLVNSESVGVLDVRDESEFRAGALPGAQWIPLGNLAARIDELPRGKPVLVYCESGSRSVVAASLLERSGAVRVVDLAGGITAWRQASLPIAVEPEVAAAR